MQFETVRPLSAKSTRRRFARSTRRAEIVIRAAAAICLASAIRPAAAATKYWDTSTATGLTAGDGIWDTGTTANWSASTAGTTLTTFANGDTAYFQTAGTQNVTVSGTVSPLQILNQTNPTTTTITGGAINLGSGGLYISTTANSTLTINSPITLTASQPWNAAFNSPSSLFVNGNVDDGGNGFAISQTGLGRVNIAGSNTFSGGYTATAGRLIVANNNALGTGTVTLNGGTLTASTAVTLPNAIAIVAGTTSTFDLTTSNNAAALTLSGPMSGSGTFNQNNNPSTVPLTLTGNNSLFAGTLTVAQGTVRFTGVNATSAAATYNIAGGAAVVDLSSAPANSVAHLGGLLSLNTSNQAVSGNGSITLAAGAGPGTIEVGETNTSTTYASKFTDATGAVLSVIKAGTGTLTLTSANAYTGSTTVNGGGTLSVDATSTTAALSATTSIEIDPTATVNSTLRLVSVLAAGSTANLINDAAVLNVTSNSNQKGIIDLAFTNSSSASPVKETVRIFQVNGVNQPAGLYSATSVPAGASVSDEAFFADGGYLNVTSVPEPASISVFAASALLLARRRREPVGNRHESV